ncbi:MAG: glycoside hydrolase family 2 [Clostridiales bacterium]|nr:glycoside hydrolase family 2 [Clostridiales bacterium]
MKHEFQRLYTEAGERLISDPSIIPWDVYPRPHMRRNEWLNLNGVWDFSAENGLTGGKIRVPFCPESLLSGIRGWFGYGERLVYSRLFTVPGEWRGSRILLNFGAVSRKSTVLVNGRTAGESSSCYFPFSVDITDHLKAGDNLLEVVCVNDLDPAYPYGKQKIKRGGMWYTPCSGIWQTVWLEPVPMEHVRDLVCEFDDKSVTITAVGVETGTVLLDGKEYRLENGKCRITPEYPRLWSPEDPYLYDFAVISGDDTVAGYFALRKVETKTIDGTPRLCLNGKPYFFNGLLDQGYFSDGLWTPAEPGEYERDIIKMKSLGFNMLRKHIKVEPELFYYYCDRLGMAVFQDMVNNGEYRFFRDTVLPTAGITELNDENINRDAAARRCFAESMLRTAKELGSHPSVVYWTIFNEGWGQFEADRMYGLLKEADPTRPIDSTSGWFHRKKTDVDSLHIYFKKLRPGRRRELPLVISEFGGYVWKDEVHSFNLDKTYGYRILKTREDFAAAIRKLYLDELLPLVKNGLSAAVYTQVSDVEDETNGLLTSDRKVMKLEPPSFKDVSDKLFEASVK